jgi:hypothetical protein
MESAPNALPYAITIGAVICLAGLTDHIARIDSDGESAISVKTSRRNVEFQAVNAARARYTGRWLGIRRA